MSGAGGRASLQTLLDEPDFALASFLLSVLGEGTFLNLLAFLERHAPDPVTRQVAHLALQDEARHVAFGMAHLEHQVAARARAAGPAARRDRAPPRRPARHRRPERGGLRRAGRARRRGVDAGRDRARATRRVQALQAEMDEGRQRRLVRLGFTADEAAALSALHTRNFM